MVPQSEEEMLDTYVSGIVALRGIFNLSQSELSVLAGVSRATINTLENQADKFVSPQVVSTLKNALEGLGGWIAYPHDGGVFVRVSKSGAYLGKELRKLKGRDKLARVHLYALEQLSEVGARKALSEPESEDYYSNILQMERLSGIRDRVEKVLESK